MRHSNIRVLYIALLVLLGVSSGLGSTACSSEPGPNEPEAPRVGSLTQAASGCALQIVAHEDDDILFMSPDLLGDIRQGRCIRTVFVTAGDAGSGSEYWLTREAGARAAYAAMAAVPNSWTTADAGIAGHSIPVNTLQGKDIQLVFLRLPDGCQEHRGCGSLYAGQSMERLWNGSITAAQTVDDGAAKSYYTRDELIAVLRQLIIRFAPAQLRLQNYVEPIDVDGRTIDGDHPDHHAAAYFGYEAQRGLLAPSAITGYYGYPISDRPENVSGELLQAKRNVFLAYAAHDTRVCENGLCPAPMYESWFPRQYKLDATANALLRPRHAGPPRLMIVGDSISHGNDGNQTWRYRLHEHLRVSGVPFDFVGPHRGPNTGSYPIVGWDDDHYARWGCITREIVFPELYAPEDLHCDPGHSMAERVSTFQPDVMLVHLGSNDMGWITNATGLRDTMSAFIDRARAAKPDIDIVFAQIGQVSLFRGEPRAAEFAPLIAELAAQKSRPWSRISVAPVHPAWTIAADTDSGGTHPNVHGEFTIAKAFADTLNAQYGYGRPFGPVVPPPPKVTGISASPTSAALGQPFTVSWPRVVNPGIWTTYKVQIRNHIGFGFGLVWESAPTPDLSVTYTGTLPRTGTYNIVVVSMDGTYETPSDPINFDVRGAPPKVTGIGVSPGTVVRGQPVTVTWPRVVNPGIWTTYKVQIRNHIGFGFGLVWESAATPDLSVTYTGTLPQSGIYNVVVVSTDGSAERLSDPVPLEVLPGPPMVRGITATPSPAKLREPFTVRWPRVENPGVWTTYKVQIRNAFGYGFALIWESSPTPDLSVTYTGALPRAGTYNIVVVSMDGTHTTFSDAVPLDVNGGPPKVTGITLTPSTLSRGGTFTTRWPRVNNPGVWTWYRVEVHHHQSFGFGLVWRSPETTDLEMPYAGPPLAPGIHHVVVFSDDGTYDTMSDVVPLTVN